MCLGLFRGLFTLKVAHIACVVCAQCKDSPSDPGLSTPDPRKYLVRLPSLCHLLSKRRFCGVKGAVHDRPSPMDHTVSLEAAHVSFTDAPHGPFAGARAQRHQSVKDLGAYITRHGIGELINFALIRLFELQPSAPNDIISELIDGLHEGAAKVWPTEAQRPATRESLPRVPARPSAMESQRPRQLDVYSPPRPQTLDSGSTFGTRECPTPEETEYPIGSAPQSPLLSPAALRRQSSFIELRQRVKAHMDSFIDEIEPIRSRLDTEPDMDSYFLNQLAEYMDKSLNDLEEFKANTNLMPSEVDGLFTIDVSTRGKLAKLAHPIVQIGLFDPRDDQVLRLSLWDAAGTPSDSDEIPYDKEDRSTWSMKALKNLTMPELAELQCYTGTGYSCVLNQFVHMMKLNEHISNNIIPFQEHIFAQDKSCMRDAGAPLLG